MTTSSARARGKSNWLFKGGTSLSKAYGAIERFSEDIDLVLDWQVLGYDPDALRLPRTTTQQTRIGEEANLRTVDFLRNSFAPVLRTDLSSRAGVELTIKADGQDVLVFYPKALSLSAIQPQIRLEIGPMAAWIPHEDRAIGPYAAEVFGDLFKSPTSTVRTIVAKRTFWEKATILHQEAHRDPNRLFPQRYSRHYYDLYRLSRTPIRASALSDLRLLHEVVEFKKRFYPSGWANYQAARAGTFRLRSMKEMLFGVIPTFEEIVEGLAELELEINSLSAGSAIAT